MTKLSIKEIILSVSALLLVIVLFPYTKKPQILDEVAPQAVPETLDEKHERIAFLANGKMAERFLVPLELHGEKEIIYGNADIGFFKINLPSKYQNQAWFLPPTYKSEVVFCRESEPDHILLRKTFKNPQLPLLKEIVLQKSGDLSAPYYLLGGQIIADHGNARAFIPLIINRLGEILWAHMPASGKKQFLKYPILKKVGPGVFGIMFGENWSYFEVFNLKGEVLDSMDPRLADPPFIIHHDFAPAAGSKMFTLGHKLHYFRNLFPILSGTDFLSLFLPPLSILSTPLILVDIKKNQSRIIWDPIDTFNPLKTSLAETSEEFRNAVWSKPQHFVVWGEKAQIDWTHGNTVEYYPKKGILVSLRNLSKVVFLDPHTFKVLWTLGNDATDTFQTFDEKHSFYHQHHTQLLPSGYLLMLDNHSSPPAPTPMGSRVLVIGLDQITKKAKVVWNFQPPSDLRIRNRGSTNLLKNGNILVFYPATPGGADLLYEIDRKTGKEVANMNISFANVDRNFSDRQLLQLSSMGLDINPRIQEGGGNRAEPLYSIGYEEASLVHCKI